MAVDIVMSIMVIVSKAIAVKIIAMEVIVIVDTATEIIMAKVISSWLLGLKPS